MTYFYPSSLLFGVRSPGPYKATGDSKSPPKRKRNAAKTPLDGDSFELRAAAPHRKAAKKPRTIPKKATVEPVSLESLTQKLLAERNELDEKLKEAGLRPSQQSSRRQTFYKKRQQTLAAITQYLDSAESANSSLTEKALRGLFRKYKSQNNHSMSGLVKSHKPDFEETLGKFMTPPLIHPHVGYLRPEARPYVITAMRVPEFRTWVVNKMNAVAKKGSPEAEIAALKKEVEDLAMASYKD